MFSEPCPSAEKPTKVHIIFELPNFLKKKMILSRDFASLLLSCLHSGVVHLLFYTPVLEKKLLPTLEEQPQ